MSNVSQMEARSSYRTGIEYINEADVRHNPNDGSGPSAFPAMKSSEREIAKSITAKDYERGDGLDNEIRKRTGDAEIDPYGAALDFARECDAGHEKEQKDSTNP
jgi:hypothetical protein